jgi:hypothetical protein
VVHSQYINIQVHTHAKADVVYALLRDGASWPTWTSIDSFELERAVNENRKESAQSESFAGGK